MILYTKSQKALIWLDSFVGLEYKIKLSIINACQDFCEITQNLVKFYQIITKSAGDSVYNNMAAAANDNYLQKVLASLAQRQIICVPYGSKNYPESLKQTPAPPIVLYCKGNVLLLERQMFAIVGSRATPPQIIKLTKQTANQISKHFTIVTGLAQGGDTAAVQGGLENSNVICVLAYGFDFAYPEENRQLLEDVYKSGLAVTEHTPATAPRDYLFPVRNRIIAGLSKGVLIVSGGQKSGTFHTGNYALNYGRDLFAFPYNCGTKVGACCNYFIKSGAALVECGQDILLSYNISLQEKPLSFELNDTEQTVYDALLDNDLHINLLLIKTGLSIKELMPVLAGLEIKNIIEKNAANLYSAKKQK